MTQTTTKPGRQARAAFESDAEAFRHFASLTPLSPNKIDTSLGRINKNILNPFQSENGHKSNAFWS